MNQPQERQREDIEADIAAEDGIRGAERHAEAPRQPLLPAPGDKQADQRRQEQGRAERQRSELPSSRQRDLDAFTCREHRPYVADGAQRTFRFTASHAVARTKVMVKSVP